MIRLARWTQWFCAFWFFADFGVAVWRMVYGRWGWAAFELSLALFMAVMWRVNGWAAERMHEELYR